MSFSYPLRIVVLLFLLSLIAGAITGNSLYFRLCNLWGVVLLTSWVMSWMALRGVSIRRTARSLRSQVGQIYEERFDLKNSSRFPRLWVEIQDASNLPGSRGSHVLTLIGGRESRSYLARSRLIERGVFQLGPTVLVSGDLFGLFPVKKSFPSQESLLVYPMIFEVRDFPHPAGLLPGGEALRRRTPHITSNAAGVREYEPGDPLNRIHWVSTARRNRLMVKEFELDPLAEVWMILDAARNVHASKPYTPPEFDPQDIWRRRFKFQLPPASLEYAVTVAASLGRYYLRRGRAVGLVYSGHTLRVLPADRGGRQLGKILEALALVRAEGVLPLQSLVEAQARHLPRGSTVIMITPSASELVFRTTDMVIRRGLRPVVVLLDNVSFGGYFPIDHLRDLLLSLGVPTYVIAEGDNLTEKLSSYALALPMRVSVA